MAFYFFVFLNINYAKKIKYNGFMYCKRNGTSPNSMVRCKKRKVDDAFENIQRKRIKNKILP